MDKKILIVYFSHSGNTTKVASAIQELCGGVLFEVQPLSDYPKAYNDIIKQSKIEIEAEEKPKLKVDIENAESYDIIFVGSPNWWSTMAPPISSFLSGHNFSGKTIVPFSTHGGGGSGYIAQDISLLCPDSNVLDIFETYDNGSNGLESKVASWLSQIGIIK